MWFEEHCKATTIKIVSMVLVTDKRPDIKEGVAKVTKLNWHFFETDILLFSFVIESRLCGFSAWQE